MEDIMAAAAKSCPTLRSHRWQPTRLRHPWDSPGNNTGVGCHFLLQCMEVKSESEVTRSCLTLSDPMDCSLPSSSIHGIFQARVLEWGATAFSELAQGHINELILESKLKILTLHSLFQFSSVQFSRSVVSDSSRTHGLQPTRLLHPWDFPGKSTGVGCHCLLHKTVYICIYIIQIYSFESYADNL